MRLLEYKLKESIETLKYNLAQLKTSIAERQTDKDFLGDYMTRLQASKSDIALSLTECQTSLAECQDYANQLQQQEITLQQTIKELSSNQQDVSAEIDTVTKTIMDCETHLALDRKSKAEIEHALYLISLTS